MTLAKPRKKGLVSLIFSRFFVIVILLAIQIAFLVVFNVWLHDYMPLYTALMMTLTIVGVIYLFNSGMDSSAKLTWMFIIAILPIAGVAMLAFLQTSIGNRKLKHRVQELIAGSQEVIRQPEGVMEKLSGDLSGTQDLNWYLNQSNCFPLYDNTRTDFFPLGEDMFASMLEDLKKRADVLISTDDGSLGTHGTVIDAIREGQAEADVMFACGPKPMLRAVKEYCGEKGMACYVSMEERMACGVGVCLGCVCRTTDINDHSKVRNARVCKDGPVFDAEEVDLT